MALLCLVLCASLSAPLQLGGSAAIATADRLAWSEDGQTLEASGGVEWVQGPLTVRADSLHYDARSGRATARGHVLFLSFPYLGVADEAELSGDGAEARFKGALFFRKSGISAEALRGLRTLDDVRRLGKTELVVTGRVARRLAADRWEVEDVAFVPCDCDPTQANWKIEAARGNFQAGERAILEWTRVSVHRPPLLGRWVEDVPVLPPLPWMYVPLSPRRSGLLMPKVQGTPLSGLDVEQPLFLALGESHDLTLTPSYLFGAGPSTPGGSLPVFGVRGPRLHAEYRYVPDEESSGRATGALLWDLREQRDPLRPGSAALVPAAGGALAPRTRGARGELSLSHVQSLGGGWAGRADLSAVSDGNYVRDLNPDVLGREAQYLRSTASLSRRGGDGWLGVDVVLRQDLRWGHALLGGDRDLTGAQVPGPSTLQRLPALRAELFERPLAGPLTVAGSASFVRVAPLSGAGGDEGTDGRFDPVRPDVDGTQADGRWQPGEREARMRLDLRPRLAGSWRLGQVASVSSWMAWRQDGWVGESSGQVIHRGYPSAGVQMATRLEGQLGAGAVQTRHVVEPSVALQSIPVVLGAAPAVAYDEVDAAISGPLPLQGVAVLRQRFLQAPSGAERLRVELGQGVDLALGRAADAFARVGADVGPFRLSGTARYDPVRSRWAQLQGTLRVGAPRTGAWVAYERLLLTGSDRTRRGVDELLGRPVLEAELPLMTVAEQLTAGASATFRSGLGLRYEALVGPRPPAVLPAGGFQPIRQQTLAASYGPACDCWRMEGQLVARPNPLVAGAWTWQFGVSLTLAGFGTFGTGG